MFVVWKEDEMWVVRRVVVTEDEGFIGVLVMELVGEAPDIPQACFFDLLDDDQHRVIIETQASLQDDARCGQDDLEVFDDDVLTRAQDVSRDDT